MEYSLADNPKNAISIWKTEIAVLLTAAQQSPSLSLFHSPLPPPLFSMESNFNTTMLPGGGKKYMPHT